jgi:hypothetical protein
MSRWRHKLYDYRQTKMLPISSDRQILPGTFEVKPTELVDGQLDLSVFEPKYYKDDGGAPAYDTAILPKIVLSAYSRGITSSRSIERLSTSVPCRPIPLSLPFCGTPAPQLRLSDRRRCYGWPAICRNARETKNAVGHPTTRMWVKADM